jgi:hypothetical protein
MRQWISIRGPGGMRMGQSIGPEDFGPPKLPSWRRYEIRQMAEINASATKLNKTFDSMRLTMGGMMMERFGKDIAGALKTVLEAAGKHAVPYSNYRGGPD